MTRERLLELAKRYDDAAESAAHRFLHGTSGGGPSGSTQSILNLFAVAAALLAHAQAKGGE